MLGRACFVPSSALLALVLVACGPTVEPASAPAPVAAPSVGPSAPSAPSSVPSATDAPTDARARKPFEVYSACTDIVTVVFAEDPKAAGTGRRTIAPSSSIDAPRDADGTQTVWLLDSTGEPLVKVHVTRGMKRVEIGRSCRTLDAR